jgi:hypothetical protein
MIVEIPQRITCFISTKAKSGAITRRPRAGVAHQPAHRPHGHHAPFKLTALAFYLRNLHEKQISHDALVDRPYIARPPPVHA